jgi:lipopolysaccharide transport system permease protein
MPGLLSLFIAPFEHSGLVKQLVRREILGRYRGSFLGLLWSFVTPVLMLTVYTFVFGMIFRSRWTADGESRFEFALVLFAGLIVFNLFSECVTRAPGLVLANVNYVKKVIFPLEILPWVVLGSALFHAAISLLVLAGALALTQGLHPTILLLPLVLAPLLLLILGLSWLLAALGVFVRDIGQFINLAMTALLFLSPIFYPASALPESVRDWLFLNPLTFMIEQTRAVLIWGKWPDWGGLGLYALLMLPVAWLGFAWFQRTRKGFADVL